MGLPRLGRPPRVLRTTRRSMSLWEPALPRARLPKRMICSGSNRSAISRATALIVALSNEAFVRWTRSPGHGLLAGYVRGSTVAPGGGAGVSAGLSLRSLASWRARILWLRFCQKASCSAADFPANCLKIGAAPRRFRATHSGSRFVMPYHLKRGVNVNLCIAVQHIDCIVFRNLLEMNDVLEIPANNEFTF